MARGEWKSRILGLARLQRLALASLFILSPGCVSGDRSLPRLTRDSTLASLRQRAVTDGAPEATISPGSVAGRIARIKDFARNAGKRDELDRQMSLRRFRAQLGESSTPRVIKLELIAAFEMIDDPLAVSGLIDVARDPDSSIRYAACTALGEKLRLSGDDRVLDELHLRSETDVSSDVRLAAIRGLGESKHPSTVRSLASALEDRDPAIQLAAMDALQQITDADHGRNVKAWQAAIDSQDGVVAALDRTRR